MQLSGKNFKRIVVKIGSSFLKAGTTGIDEAVINDLAGQIASLHAGGKEVVLVSSGAIAIGMSVLKFSSRPKELSRLQAAASVGQHFLMSVYSRCFHARGIECGQVLLTWEDFNERSRYLNAKNTISRLLGFKVVPVINENDTVSTSEIKFGDNDRLSALVASMLSADILLILSDVEGLLDKEKKLIPLVDSISPQIKALACPSEKQTCVGGMVTKIEAAQISTDSGIPCVIASGSKPDILRKVIDHPHAHGTLFVQKKALDAKERWIAFGTKPKGVILVDKGAKEALIKRKSLLSVGVVGVEGTFERQAIVDIADSQGVTFARGRADVSSKLLDKIKGARHDREVIHSDNIVLI